MLGVCVSKRASFKNSFVKLLLDQNISFRLIKKIESDFPGSEQVRRVGLENKDDKVIWEFASREDFTIVTFDFDFYHISLICGRPVGLDKIS